MSPSKNSRLRVVVDGSNLATEGRVTPSLKQLDEAVSAFKEENPPAEIIVVADATFEHRVSSSERSHFNEAVLAGEIVTPPAGAVGRGDAFILKIADRISGVVLSNDSFQEFQDDYPWLFEVGRLVGGKPVRGVGWVFTPRSPVRNAKVTRVVKKLALTLPSGAKPTIGTTLTPVTTRREVLPAKRATAKAVRLDEKTNEMQGTKVPSEVTKKVNKVVERSKSVTAKKNAPKSSPPKAATPKVAIKAAPPKAAPPKNAPKSSPPKAATPKVAVKSAPPKNATKSSPPRAAKKVTKPPVSGPKVEPTAALRRGRQPVNAESDFTMFKSAYRVGSRVPGEVTTFTSHGAVIKVQLKGGQHVECYAPTAALGSPSPTRARDVLKRGDQRTFRLVTVDTERRIAELALS